MPTFNQDVTVVGSPPDRKTVAQLFADGESGQLRLFDDGNTTARVQADANEATLWIGGTGSPGELQARNKDDGEVALLRAEDTTNGGHLRLLNAQGKETVHANARDANIRVGGNGSPGQLFARNKDWQAVAWLRAEDATNGGHLRLLNAQGKETVHANAKDANIRVGGNGMSGRLFARNRNGQPVAWLGAEDATNGGHLRLLDTSGRETIHGNAKDATIRAGGNGRHGRFLVRNAAGNVTVSLEGSTGDVQLMGADCAEEFAVDASDVEPGTVMIIGDDQGVLQISGQAYDKRVAGVVSGAGEYRPGIVLDSHRQGSHLRRAAIALVGKVYCKVDATQCPVEVGDLLTTSDVAGHAMKAVDPLRAFGAVIGKALASLDRGAGLVPVLVTLR